MQQKKQTFATADDDNKLISNSSDSSSLLESAQKDVPSSCALSISKKNCHERENETPR